MFSTILMSLLKNRHALKINGRLSITGVACVIFHCVCLFILLYTRELNCILHCLLFHFIQYIMFYVYFFIVLISFTYLTLIILSMTEQVNKIYLCTTNVK